MTDRELLARALEARENAYAPYSGYRVGAALLAESGKVYTGVNVENASYPATLCAERVAFGQAVSAGERRFCAIAVAGGQDKAEPNVPPCGTCRQVMAELCDPGTFRVIWGNDQQQTVLLLRELLPFHFHLEEKSHADD